MSELANGQADTTALVMTEWATTYHDCATRHNGLVEAVKQ